MDSEFLSASELAQWTGNPASTWRYWAHIGFGPSSFKLGRRRVWRRTDVQEWIAAQQEAANGAGGVDK